MRKRSSLLSLPFDPYLSLDKFFFTKTLTRITPHIESKRKYEQNAEMHTWIYESQNLIPGGIIIKGE
jgi:hypothetical protein